jgi:hypothetical protein
MKTFLFFGVAMALSACASGPPAPDWQINAKNSMERSIAAYMSGNDKVEAQEFDRARGQMASTGQVAMVARVELIRCASHVASLVLDNCPGFETLREDAAAPERAYADYLDGHVQPKDVALLPEQHRGVTNASEDSATAAVAGINDSFSRLVAAGVLFRTGRANPALLDLAVETASNQGWSRPLLAWLGVQAMRAEKLGDVVEMQRIRRRIDIVQKANF